MNNKKLSLLSCSKKITLFSAIRESELTIFGHFHVANILAHAKTLWRKTKHVWSALFLFIFFNHIYNLSFHLLSFRFLFFALNLWSLCSFRNLFPFGKTKWYKLYSFFCSICLSIGIATTSRSCKIHALGSSILFEKNKIKTCSWIWICYTLKNNGHG